MIQTNTTPTTQTSNLAAPAPEAFTVKPRFNLLQKSLFVLLASGISLMALTAYAADAANETDSLPQSIKPVISSGPLPEDLPLLKPSSSAPTEKDPLAWDETMPAPQPQAPTPAPAAMPTPVAEPTTPAAPIDAAPVPMPSPMPEAKGEEPVKEPIDKVAAPPTDGDATMEMRMKAVEESITFLKNKNADLEALQVAVGELQQKLANLNLDAPRAQSDSAAPAPVKKKVKKSTRAKKPRRSTAKKTVQATASSQRRILKGAKPGTAWISKPGSNEIRTVTVGQTLPGLGKVTAVVKNSEDHWVVNTTNGRID